MTQLYFLPESEKTSLLEWLADRTDVAGFQQIAENGLRYFQDLTNGERYVLTAGPKEKRTYTFGEEKLSVAAFETVSDRLTEAPENPEVNWLVIDGIGQLELRKEGLHLLLQNMVLGALPGLNVVLIIADAALEKVLKRYQLQDRATRLLFKGH